MNKRRNKIILVTFSIAVTIAIVIVASIVRGSSVVGGLSVNVSTPDSVTIANNDKTNIISSSEIEQLLLDEFPGLTSSRVKDVNTKKIERYLETNPYIESARAALSVGGRIIVNVTARRPIVRVYYNNQCFFIDKHGNCFPARRNGNINVIVANGCFRQHLPTTPDTLDISAMANDTLHSSYDIVCVWKLAKYLDESTDRYSLLFDQIYLNCGGDLILQPKLGDYEIVVGDTSDLDDKFKRLKTFYAKGLPHAGYDSYSQVSLKYKGQVVCTKRKTN